VSGEVVAAVVIGSFAAFMVAAQLAHSRNAVRGGPRVARAGGFAHLVAYFVPVPYLVVALRPGPEIPLPDGVRWAGLVVAVAGVGTCQDGAGLGDGPEGDGSGWESPGRSECVGLPCQAAVAGWAQPSSSANAPRASSSRRRTGGDEPTCMPPANQTPSNAGIVGSQLRFHRPRDLGRHAPVGPASSPDTRVAASTGASTVLPVSAAKTRRRRRPRTAVLLTVVVVVVAAVLLARFVHSHAVPGAGPSATAAPGSLRATPVDGQVTGVVPAACQQRAARDGQPLPDPVCTPGVVSTAVSQNNLDSTICRSGYTKMVRPPESQTGAFKRRSCSRTGNRAYSGTTSWTTW